MKKGEITWFKVIKHEIKCINIKPTWTKGSDLRSLDQTPLIKLLNLYKTTKVFDHCWIGAFSFHPLVTSCCPWTTPGYTACLHNGQETNFFLANISTQIVWTPEIPVDSPWTCESLGKLLVAKGRCVKNLHNTCLYNLYMVQYIRSSMESLSINLYIWRVNPQVANISNKKLCKLTSLKSF